MTTTTIPAAGFYVVWPGPGRPNGYARVPVIGWDSETNWPVTMANDYDYPEDTALKCAEGAVCDLQDFGTWWPSVGAWLADVRPDTNRVLLVG